MNKILDKNKKPDHKKELHDICTTGEIRLISDKTDKAVYILCHDIGEKKIPKETICEYFEITRNTLQKRLWSTLLGHTKHSVKEPRYLSPKHERELADQLDLDNKICSDILLFY